MDFCMSIAQAVYNEHKGFHCEKFQMQFGVILQSFNCGHSLNKKLRIKKKKTKWLQLKLLLLIILFENLFNQNIQNIKKK